MEAVGSFLDEEWESLSKLFSSEDSDLLMHFNEENLFPNQVDDQSLFFPSDAFDKMNFYCVLQESSNSSDIEGAPFANPVGENGVNFLHNLTTNTYESSDFCTGLMLPVFPNDPTMEEIVPSKTNAEDGDLYKEMTSKRKYETPEIQTQDNNHSPDQSPRKKPRLSRDKGQKSKTKKNKKGVQNDEEENINGVGNGQSSSTCSYEEDDDSNCNGGTNSEFKGKAKASRGSATDPQSIYARRRRERINERLRILQNLVPNGTKVDISTMLEEALHYVKFLQLQIKLLSSDELWMYAPIAYNGIDIGLYRKINIPNL